ncbi:hypothetical protein BGX26_002609 [Mortierella sp. AD094]|nr:hypothetical protein BGX26_002609 [Mortierella sp. AD094]
MYSNNSSSGDDGNADYGDNNSNDSKNPFNSTKKKEQELEEAKRKAAEEMAQREAIRHEEYDSRQRINAAMGQGPYGRAPSDSNDYGNNGRGGPEEQPMYSFENTAEDDDTEREIDQNLRMMEDFMDRLKQSVMTRTPELTDRTSA